jgi:hypothetical protein
MKSLDILLCILDDAQAQTCADTTRDKITILSRYKDEGLSFLGITLPYFSEWLELSLEEGKVVNTIYSKFRKKPGKRSVLPCFLHGLTSLVFDSQTGLVRSDINETAVFFIRQVCLFHKKVFVVCDPERDAASKASYEELDRSLRSFSIPRDYRTSLLKAVLDRVIPDLEIAFVEACADRDLKPRHGPGATADKRWGNSKFRARDFLSRWNGTFSWEELYGFATIHQSGGGEVQPHEELPVRVVSVPKTMKTSRIICVEPTVMQYAQQLTAARLLRAFEVTELFWQLNFDDQSVNQRLAQIGSVSGEWATMDLSEASDRLHSKLVSLIFQKSSTIRRHVFACRSSRAKLPSGEILPLRKYASMGSALTFPVEAFAFYVVALTALVDFYRQRDGDSIDLHGGKGRFKIPNNLLSTLRRKVFVFGDDIIVPAESYQFVAEYLHAFGLKVNTRKSFSRGLFRESCGADWVNGCLVTPVYLRQFQPSSARDATEFVSWVSMANRFHLTGQWKTAEYTRNFLDSIARLPFVAPTCGGLGFFHYTGAYQPTDWSKKASSWLVNTFVTKSGSTEDQLRDYDALLKVQLSAGPDAKSDESVLSELVRLETATPGRPLVGFGDFRRDSWADTSLQAIVRSLDRSPRRSSLKLRRKMVTAY